MKSKINAIRMPRTTSVNIGGLLYGGIARSVLDEWDHGDQVLFSATDSTMLATSSHASVVISIVS